MTDAPKFEPKKLPRESVEAPMEPHWRVMGGQEEKRLHDQAIQDHRRFSPLGPRMRRRLLRYTLGTMTGFGVTAYFLVSMSLNVVLIFVGSGFVIGLAVAILRPGDYLAGLLYGVAGFVGAYVGGAHTLIAALAGMLFLCIGMVIGRLEEMKRFDLED